MGHDCTRQVYGFEVQDAAGRDRRAWAFVIERDGALEIEDLYVRPEFRGKGYGRVLAEKVAELARAKVQSLRLWVPFADSKQENPANFPALVTIARLLGLRFRPCPVIWAAYFATNEEVGDPEPIEPLHIPACEVDVRRRAGRSTDNRSGRSHQRTYLEHLPAASCKCER